MRTGERLGFKTFATKYGGMGKDENINKIIKKLLCILNTRELELTMFSQVGHFC